MKIKEKLWSQLEDKASKITDRLGKKIDKGIKETVIGLWALGFTTTGSCEGHLNWGEKGPWIDIGENLSDKDLEELKSKPLSITELFKKYPRFQKLKERNLKVQKKLLKLLTHYYGNHKVSEDVRLILTEIGIYGSTRIINQGVGLQELNTAQEQKRTLKRYQQEIQHFGKFMKTRYLSKLTTYLK